jgi:hypothetical protein
VYKTFIATVLALSLWASPALAQEPRLVYPFGGLTVERFLLLSLIQQDLVVLASFDSVNLAFDYFAQQEIKCGPFFGITITPVQVSDAARARMQAMTPPERATTSAPLVIILTAIEEGCEVVDK